MTQRFNFSEASKLVKGFFKVIVKGLLQKWIATTEMITSMVPATMRPFTLQARVCRYVGLGPMGLGEGSAGSGDLTGVNRLLGGF